MMHQVVPAKISLRGHDPQPATLSLEYRPTRMRATRAIGTLLGFWILTPIVALIPPHIPWALIAFIAGIYFAARQWRGEYEVGAFEGKCPRCSSPLKLEPGARIRIPHPMSCYHCHHNPVLEQL
jgi:hypothetical protein